jgi:hypothetical protein
MAVASAPALPRRAPVSTSSISPRAGSVPPDFAVAAGADHLDRGDQRRRSRSWTRAEPPCSVQQSGASFFTGVPIVHLGSVRPGCAVRRGARPVPHRLRPGRRISSGGYCVAVSETADPSGQLVPLLLPGEHHVGVARLPPHGRRRRLRGVRRQHVHLPRPHDRGRQFQREPHVGPAQGRSVCRRPRLRQPGGRPERQQHTTAAEPPRLVPRHLARPRFNVVYVLAEVYDGRNYPVYRWDVPPALVTLTGRRPRKRDRSRSLSPQSGEFSIEESNDWRSHGFEYRNGYGWTANTIACNPGGGTVNCVRWAQIDITSGALGPQGSGIISSERRPPDLPGRGGQRLRRHGHRLHPQELVLATRESAVSGRLATDPAGTVGSESWSGPGRSSTPPSTSPPRGTTPIAGATTPAWPSIPTASPSGIWASTPRTQAPPPAAGAATSFR